MNTILRNVLAVIIGLFLGGVVNMALITISGSIIPPPEGVDPANMDSLKESIHLFQPKHFVFPFLAHALGTLVGAFITTKIAATNKFNLAMVIGAFFLIGGIMMVMQLPGPMWFNVLDLVVAYIPMAWLGNKIAGGRY